MQLDEMIARDGLQLADLVGMRVEVAITQSCWYYHDPVRPHGVGTVVGAHLQPDLIGAEVVCIVQFDDPAGAGRSATGWPVNVDRAAGRCAVQAKNLRPAAARDATSDAVSGSAAGASVSS